MISVVIPVYNGEKYLAESIDSVLNQTYKDIEIILVDDKSEDASLAVARKYVCDYPDKIKLIEQKENKGAGITMNTGIDAAEGEYVLLLGDDDWLDLDICEQVYLASKEKPDMVLMNKTNWIGERRVLNKAFPDECIGVMTTGKRKKAMVHLANQEGFVFVAAYRRSFFEEYNLFFPDILPEDIPITMLYIAYADKIVKVGSSYNYRIHDESTAHKKNGTFYLNIYKAALLMRQNFIDRDLYDLYREEVDFAFILGCYYFTVYNAMARYDERPLEVMHKVRGIMQELLPDWKNNVYIPLCWERWRYELLKLNDESPERLAERFPDCDKFMQQVRNGEIKEIFGDWENRDANS